MRFERLPDSQALWQTGIPGAPLVDSGVDGASEHVATHFVQWCRRIACAMRQHKERGSTREARNRSGAAYGKHGLTPEQVQFRQERAHARSDLDWGRRLHDSLDLSKGKRPKGKGKGVPGASEHMLIARPYWQMTTYDKWYLAELWNGNLF